MFINNMQVGSYMTTYHSFAGIRRIDQLCKPVQWDLSMELATVELDDGTIDEQSLLATIIFQKLIFWLDTQLTDIIIAEAADESIDSIINVSANNFMYCPGAPTDDLLVQLLHAKIQCILGERLKLGNLTLKSSDSMSAYTYNSVIDYRLPDETSSYILDPLYDIPWWFRSTIDTFDMSKPDDEDEPFVLPEDPLAVFEEQLHKSLTETECDDPKEPAEVVSIVNYAKPTLVK